MKKLAVENFLEREKKYFKKIDINDLINSKSKIETNDIYNLKLDEKFFNFNDNYYYSIFIAIVDKNDKKILETKNINGTSKNKELYIDIRNLSNNKILDNYFIYISTIPILEENKELIKNFIKFFYSPISMLPSNNNIRNKFEIISMIILLFSIFFTLTQVDITNKLVNNYGFVDSLINNLSIFNSMTSYFYDSFIMKNFYPLFIIYIVSLVILLVPSLINYIINLLIFFWKRSCKYYKPEYLYLKIKLNNDLLNVISNFKEVYYNPSFLFNYTLMYILLMTLLLAPLMKIFSKENIKINLNYKGKIIEKYFDCSNFPEFVKLKLLNDKEEIINVYMMGYDSTYTYYYDYAYIKEQLDKKFKPFNDDEYDKREMNISEIHTYYLDNLSKKELKYIKNTDYKLVERIQERFYEIRHK